MTAIIGIIVVMTCVFGGYMASGGYIMVIVEALPSEATIIAGAATGAYLIANKNYVIKKSFKEIALCFKSPKWNAEDYKSLLYLMYQITKKAKGDGMLALEKHVDAPKDSQIFTEFPKLLEDDFAVNMICDTLRMVTMNMDDPHQIEEILEKQIAKRTKESLSVAKALETTADGLPAIGIVAAVLGVIKTMSSVDKPPMILGGMIASALVGTFLGVFLSYCFVGPLATKLKNIKTQDMVFYIVIKSIIVSYLQGNMPQVAVEVGRNSIPTILQPSFLEMEEFINQDASEKKE